MKKLNLLITIILLVVGISACETTIVEIPIDTVEPVVPVVPDSNNNGVDTSPDVIVEFVDRFITVPATLERQRQYLPGTYMLAESQPNNQNGYVFSVVVIDDYGRIAGVYIDQTLSTRNLFRSPDGNFYTFLAGNQLNVPDSYRKVDLSTAFTNYPKVDDAIRSVDLVIGIDRAAITNLTRVSVNETKQLTSSTSAVIGQLSYQQQMQLVAQKIIDDNTTYGFNFIERNNVLTTNSIEGITEPLDVALFLVQSILDGPAALPEDAVLRKVANPLYGVYQAGTYVSFSPMAYVDAVLVHGLSVMVVDEFGRMAGLYLDEIVPSTARATVVASKQILKTAVGLSTTQPLEWFEQANLVSNQILANQGINGFTLASPFAVVRELAVDLPILQITNLPNIAIRANEILLATKENLSRALFKNYLDGTYLVSSPSLFVYVTIYNQQLIDVYVDRFVLKEQAEVFRADQVRNVERIVRQFSPPTGITGGDVLVYASGTAYYSLTDVTQLNNLLLPAEQQLAADELLVLTDSELATLRPVPGWHTASSLVQVDATQASWYNDQHKLATTIEAKGNITDFLIENGRITNLTDLSQIQASPILELVANALFQAREPNADGWIVPFIPQSTPLADGSYFVYTAPTISGSIYTSYVVVNNGRIITWIIDATFFANNQVSSFLFSTNPVKDDLIDLSNSLRQSQTSILYSLIDNVAPEPTIRPIDSITLTDIEEEVFSAAPFESLIDEVIRQATIERQNQDIQWIRDYFLNDVAYFSGTTLIGSQNKDSWLPNSLSHPALSQTYRLLWRSIDRDLFLLRDGESFTARVARLDSDRTAVIDLEIFAPDVNLPISIQQFELPLRRPSTHAITVLNSKAFNFPSLTLLEDTQFTLPTSSEFTISWQSRRPEVMSATGLTARVTQATTVELIAYVDLDNDGVIGPNDPVRVYPLTVIPISQAITRLRTEMDTNKIGESIGSKVILGRKSSIWGLTYNWITNSQSVVLVTTADETHLYVRSLDFQQTIQLTADIETDNGNVPNIIMSYRVNAGNKLQYTNFATMDLPIMNTAKPLYQGQSIFDDFAAQGRFYGSEISFYTTDFGQFINAQGEVIFQHPTIDACFDAVVTAKYSGGAVDSSVSSTHSFCVMSLKTLQQQISEDRNQLQNYVIDLGLLSHVNIPISLPLVSWIHQFPIVWTVDTNPSQDAILEFFDVSNISSGIIIVNTTNEAIDGVVSLKLTARIDVVAGTPPVQTTKQILIEFKN